MRLIIWHCKELNYKDTRPSTKPFQLKNDEKLKKTLRKKKSGNFTDIIAVFTCIERGDNALNVKKATDEIGTMLNMLKSKRQVVIVPFAHLSSHLSPPQYALGRLDEMVKTLRAKKIETQIVSFGYHKDFEFHFHGYGHPGSVAFRDFPVRAPALGDCFDFDEAQKTGLFICGSPGSGKSNLAFWIADELVKNGVLVYVFDPSQVWAKQSGIRRSVAVSEEEARGYTELPRQSTVFDISLLPMSKQTDFVERFARTLFNDRARSKYRPETFLFFEEAHLYIAAGKLSVGVAEELMRIVSVGRNYAIRCALLTQFTSMVDEMPVKMCKQRYFGYCSEKKEIDYLKSLIGDDADDLPSLEVGEFIYYCGTEPKRFRVPLFEKF